MSDNYRQTLSRLCTLLLYFIGVSCYSSSLTFVDNGHFVKMMEIDERVRTGGTKMLTVNNPTDSRIKSYQGVSLIPLLDAVFNSAWKDRARLNLQHRTDTSLSSPLASSSRMSVIEGSSSPILSNI